MGRNGATKSTRARSAGVSSPPGRTLPLPRALLEEAVVRLTEENTRLRREVIAHGALWQIAHQDPLTNLWNRRYADERLAQEMSRAQRHSGYRFSMVLVDVDQLKRINDQMGHAAGDQALRWVACFLKEGLRGHDLCCRLGGDEFLLILPASGERECGDLVERIRRRWRVAVAADEGAVAVSMGTASFPNQGTTVESLLGVADNAMYANKRRQDPSRPERRPPPEGARPQVQAESLPSTTRLAKVASSFRCFLLFAACIVGLSCATGATLRHPADTRARGVVVSTRSHAISIVAGPVLLHAYASTSGGRMYLAPAITGTDLDCTLTSDEAREPSTEDVVKQVAEHVPAHVAEHVPAHVSARVLERNKRFQLEVPTGSVACVAASESKPVEILWHAVASHEPNGAGAAGGLGPVAGCCVKGR